jgi:hypothetical protein
VFGLNVVNLMMLMMDITKHENAHVCSWGGKVSIPNQT